MSYHDANEAMVAFQQFAQAKLQSDYAADFEARGGAEIILQDDEPDEPDQMGKTFGMLSVEQDTQSREVRTPGAWDAVIAFDIMSTPFSGATTGAANPVGYDTLLSRTVRRIISDNHDELRGLGLYRCRLESGAETVDKPTATDPTEIHTNQHRVLFTYFTD